MAKFIKVETQSAARPMQLIAIDDIGGAIATHAGTTSTLVVTMKTRATAGTYTITVTAPIGGATGFVANDRIASMLQAFNDARLANPGGYASTLNPPLTTPQAPVAQGAAPATGRGPQGQSAITQPAVYNVFLDCVFAA